MNPNENILWLSLGMLAVTYLGRVAGYWFIRYTEPNEKTQQFLQQVPGTIFVAMVAPQLLSSGWTGWLAAAVGFALAAKSGNMLLSLSAGMGVFVLLRAVF